MCGTLSDRPCEPEVYVTSDLNGNFTTSLIIPPGRKADFLGAGTYFIGADVPIGGGAEAVALFKVPATFSRGETLLTATAVFGGNFVPYRLSGVQSYGYVWGDVNGNYLLDSNEPKVDVFVLEDGSLVNSNYSRRIEIPEGTPSGIYLRANILHDADLNRSTEQRIEASIFLYPVTGGDGVPPKRRY